MTEKLANHLGSSIGAAGEKWVLRSGRCKRVLFSACSILFHIHFSSFCNIFIFDVVKAGIRGLIYESRSPAGSHNG